MIETCSHSWTEGEVYCEDCGTHNSVYCKNCGDLRDLVYDDDPREVLYGYDTGLRSALQGPYSNAERIALQLPGMSREALVNGIHGTEKRFG